MPDLANEIEKTLTAARNQGFLIVHAPSTVISFYKNHTARIRTTSLPQSPLPSLLPVPPKLEFPIPSSCETPGASYQRVWRRQTELISISDEKDFIINNRKQELFNIVSGRNISTILYVGVHLNSCIMNREFGIRQTISWGLQPIVVREVVDTIYNPSLVPYVTHEQSVRLMLGFIEKFFAPSISKNDLLHSQTDE